MKTKYKILGNISLGFGPAVALAFALLTPGTVQAGPELKGYATFAPNAGQQHLGPGGSLKTR